MIIFLFVFINIYGTVFSQLKLRDGIYLVDQNKSKHDASQPNTAAIQFNPLFIEYNPEEYDPIIIFTSDFVPFELTGMPVIQYQKDQKNFLLVSLTKKATDKLSAFTSKNLMNNIVVVVNGQALAVYKVIQPVISRKIIITRCSGNGCAQVSKQLKSAIKI